MPCLVAGVEGITADQQGVAAARSLRILGYAARESAATSGQASFKLKHGTSSSGGLVAPVELAPNESRDFLFPEGGIRVPDGVYVDMVAGTIDLSIYYALD